MYRGRLWVIRQLTGFNSAEETRKRMLNLVKAGTTGLNMLADVPSSLCIDSDHPFARGEIGVTGVPLSSLADMEEMMEGIEMDQVDISISIHTCFSPIVVAQYLALAEKRGVESSKLRGTIQNNPLIGRYRGYEPGARYLDICLKCCGDIIEYAVEHLPLWTPTNVNFGISQSHHVDTPTEVALGFSEAISYIEEVVRRGCDVEKVVGRILFFAMSDINLLEEVAKFRAMRRMWSRILKDRFGITNEKAMRFRFGSATCGYPLYPQEVLNNIVRLSYQALALVLGGAQSIFVCGFDEPVGIPSEEAQRLSLQIQHILANETGVASVADPLGGSYYIEALTNKIETRAFERIEKIDKMGGMVKAIEKKWVDKVLDECDLAYMNGLSEGRISKVGVNIFTTPIEKQPIVEPDRIPLDVTKKRLEKLKGLRESRNQEAVEGTLKVVYEKAKEKKENLLPCIIEAVKTYATVGEIFGTIQMAYGNPYDAFGQLEAPFQFLRT